MFKITVIVAVGLILVGCSTTGRSSGKQKAGEGTYGGERASLPDERPHITGIVTELKRAPGAETPSDKRILVEEKPEGCFKGKRKEGCNKLYLDVTANTRIFRKVGGNEEALVQAKSADLEKSQRVRAWHTGVLKKSYPGQGYARLIVIDATDAAGSERTANSRSPR